MITEKEDQTAVMDELWRAWVERGKRQDLASARSMKWVVGLAIILFASASAIYLTLAQ